MKKFNLLYLFIFFTVFACTEEVVTPSESVFPDKISPYETYFDTEILSQRRAELMSQLPENSLALILTNDVYQRNGDVDYEFRPASEFYYLTGFEEPYAAALIRKNGQEIEYILFVEERSGVAVNWLGPVTGTEGAVETYGADAAFEFDQFTVKMSEYLSAHNYNYLYTNFETNETLASMLLESQENLPEILDINDVIDSQRVIKSENEIDAIRNSTNVSVQAFKEVIKKIEPGMYEYEADAVMNLVRRLNGCPRNAFPTIVASGPNINTLHYIANNRQMQDEDIVMIDYGAEYCYYASDVTRTLPVNGRFTEKQKEVYQIVLESHKAVLAAAKPGVNYYDLYLMNRDFIIDALLEKGIITGNKNDIIDNYLYRQFIPAGLAHQVGLDVHDPFPYENYYERMLKENMVLAFEPHIYLYEGDQLVNPEYWNISARIEDVVLITSSGNEILSKGLPFEINEIEELMK